MKKVSAAAILPLMLVFLIGSLASAALYRFEPRYPSPSAGVTTHRCPAPEADATEMAWEAFSRKAVSAILFR